MLSRVTLSNGGSDLTEDLAIWVRPANPSRLSAEEVFDAWTPRGESALVSSPPVQTGSLPRPEVDLRVGGKVRVVMRSRTELKAKRKASTRDRSTAPSGDEWTSTLLSNGS